jgi:hypothetical protein
MELKPAIAKAEQILDEERAHPTVVYEPSAEALRSKYPGSVGEFAEAVVLLGQLNDQYRLQRTDAVQEDSRI